MDSLKFWFKKSDKASPTLKSQRTTRKIAALFRSLELFIFCFILSQFSTQFYLFSGEYLRGISATLVSPGFVFLVINAILIILLWISGQFSPGKGEKTPDFYEEYVLKCRDNRRDFRVEEKRVVAYQPKKVIRRSHSEKQERAAPEDMRRCMSEKGQRSGRKAAADDEMNGDEFRRTVEAFIARQQRILMEDDEEVET